MLPIICAALLTAEHKLNFMKGIRSQESIDIGNEQTAYLTNVLESHGECGVAMWISFSSNPRSPRIDAYVLSV